MVETIASSEALFLIATSFIVGYLTCSTIELADLEIKYKDLKERYMSTREEKEMLENYTGYYVEYEDDVA